ncbi:MAG TPA: UDP-N-acetylmuramoyl-tripeptide--D-alanyl-D-alanine ligase [Candidatus Paceibacterota bacterium]|nr:UDP-N-acetylmuramoyl-tripeptide--D-alanyl-D-alanine ligase [Candidatus Paceibacterota bacterium]
MSSFFVKTLRGILRKLSQLTIWRYRPGIIGVTGTVGKTSTKLAIKAVLDKGRRVRASAGNLNNDLGLPLAILGGWSEGELALVSRATPPGTARVRKFFFWLKVILGALWRIAFKDPNYPEILVLEYGADRPGNIKYLLKIARPNISIVTAVGDIPVHVEYYSGPDEVAREKGRLIEYLPSAGFAILNYDDEAVMNLEPRTRAHVMTYGFEKGAEVKISRLENRMDGERPVGISFKLEYKGAFVPVRLHSVFGRSHAYAAAAAASVGIVFGMNLVAISDALANYSPAGSRMQLLPGIKNTFIIDDSYNASPLSMHAALDALQHLPAKRKIAVLGDMLEIGKYTIEAHEAMGKLAAAAANVLVTVGPRSKFIAEAARAAGMKKSTILSFDTADEARKPVQDLMKQGDIVLVKASHSMELSKIVEEIKAF